MIEKQGSIWRLYPFPNSIPFTEYFFLYMYIFVQVSLHTCEHWRPEVNFQNISLSLSTFSCFKIGSLTECGAHWLSRLADLKASGMLLPPALSWDYKRAKPCLAFYVDPGNLNWSLGLAQVFHPPNHLPSPQLQFSTPFFQYTYLFVCSSFRILVFFFIFLQKKKKVAPISNYGTKEFAFRM